MRRTSQVNKYYIFIAFALRGLAPAIATTTDMIVCRWLCLDQDGMVLNLLGCQGHASALGDRAPRLPLPQRLLLRILISAGPPADCPPPNPGSQRSAAPARIMPCNRLRLYTETIPTLWADLLDNTMKPSFSIRTHFALPRWPVPSSPAENERSTQVAPAPTAMSTITCYSHGAARSIALPHGLDSAVLTAARRTISCS